MPVIDVQVHPFDRNHPGRPWASPSHGLSSATGAEMVAAMNSVGVDGAIMVSSFSAYEYDPSYALEVYNTYPDKFRVVTPVDATDPAIDDVVATWAKTPGAPGIRIRMAKDLPMDADHPGLARAPGRRLGRPAEAARSRALSERTGEGERRLHDVAQTVPLRRHLGAGAPGH